jgi:hypothetical protein
MEFKENCLTKSTNSVNIKKNVKVNFSFFDLLNESEINIKNNILKELEEYKKQLKDELKQEILEELKEENSKKDLLMNETIQSMNNSVQQLLKCINKNTDKIDKINIMNDNFIQMFNYVLDELKILRQSNESSESNESNINESEN